MKNISRLIAAAVLVGILVVVATGVWAAPKFQGTVPAPSDSGSGGGGGGGGGGGTVGGGGGTTGEPINLGTAVFTPNCTDCTVTATKVEPAPVVEGKTLVGSAFNVTITGTGSVKLSFNALPGAKIYKKGADGTWVEVPGSVVNADGTISVDVTEGGEYAAFTTP
jgi:hypothetical protein